MVIKQTFVFVCLVMFSIMTSCDNKKYNNENKTVFRYNESAGITSLDPAFARDQATIWACNQIYNGLVQLDDELLIKPCIAKKWDISENGKKYTFYLRKDVFFHEHNLFGDNKTRKVIAKDFVYSFNRLVDEKTASPGSWVFQYVEKVENNKLHVNAVNDTVLEIYLQKPFAPFLGILSMQYCSVLPHEITEHYNKEFRKNPIGTGPFTLKTWKEGVKMVMLKNKSYFEYDQGNRLPYLDAVAITFIIDKQTAFLEFVKGNLDFLSGIHPSYKDELLTPDGRLNPKYHNKFQLLSQPYLNTEYLGFLVDDTLSKFISSPLMLKKIRQAINYGFDREKMLRYLRNNIGKPAVNGFIPSGLPSFNSKLEGYSYNRDKALKLLEESGYPNGKNLPVIKLNTTSTYLDLCKYIQHELNDIGIEIDISVNPPATLREFVSGSKVNFFRGSWIADYPDAENYLSLFYSKNYCPFGPNYTHFSNEQFDKLYEDARIEVIDSIRYSMYQEMDKIIMEDAPVVVLYYDQVLRFLPLNISNIGSNALNMLTLKRVKKKN